MNGETSQPPSKLYEEFFGSQDWARIQLEKVPEIRVADYMLLPRSHCGNILTTQQLALRNSMPIRLGVELGWNKANAFLSTSSRYAGISPKSRPPNMLKNDGRICFGIKSADRISTNGHHIEACGNKKAFLERFCPECDIKFHMNAARRRAERRKVVVERDKAVLQRFRLIQ